MGFNYCEIVAFLEPQLDPKSGFVIESLAMRANATVASNM